jgi:hypothetical protein
MIISEMASRDISTVETEPAHHSAHSHIDEATLHTAPIQIRCPGRYFSFLDYVGNLVHGWNSLNIFVTTAIIQYLHNYFGLASAVHIGLVLHLVLYAFLLRYPLPVYITS